MFVFTGIHPRPSASLTNTTLLPSTGVKRSEAVTRSPGRIVTPCHVKGQCTKEDSLFYAQYSMFLDRLREQHRIA